MHRSNGRAAGWASWSSLGLLGLGLIATDLTAAPTPAAARELTPEAIGAIRWANDPRLSPDGRLILYLLGEPRDTTATAKAAPTHVWRVPFDGSRPPAAFTNGESGESSPRWSPDGRRVAFLAARGEKAKTQVWVMPADGGEARALTRFGSDVQSLAWSPDGATLACVVADPESAAAEAERAAGRDWDEVDRHLPPARLWFVDAVSGRADSLAGGRSYADPEWSPDGRFVVAIEADSPRLDDFAWHSRLVLVERGAKSVRCLLDGGVNGPLRCSPDGARVFCYPISATGKVRQNWPALVAVRDGAVSWLALDYEGTVCGGEWSPDSKSLYVTAYPGVRAQLARLDVATGRVTPLMEMLTEGMKAGTFSLDAARTRVAALAETPARPSELFAASLPKGGGAIPPAGVRRLSDHNPELGAFELGTEEVLHWKGADGWPMEGVLFKPAGYQPGRKYPTVIQVHGGPEWMWWYGWYGSWHEWAGLLASNGYVVLCPNPRGSDGYGHDFIHGNFQDWGGRDFLDIEAGTNALIERGLADSNRLGFGGWSYGGFMSAWALGHAPRYRAVVVGAALTDYASFQGTSDIIPTFLRAYFGATPNTDPAQFATRSPLAFVPEMKAATLILHGAADFRVPITQGDQLYRALKERGVPVEYVRYPREPHDFTEVAHSVDLLRRVLRFYDERLKGVRKDVTTPMGR